MQSLFQPVSLNDTVHATFDTRSSIIQLWIRFTRFAMETTMLCHFFSFVDCKMLMQESIAIVINEELAARQLSDQYG